MFEKSNPANLSRIAFENVLARQIEHASTAIDAIDRDERMTLEQSGQESSVPLAHDQRPARRTDVIEASDAGPLQRVPKCDRFQRPIPGGNGIEAHKAEAMSN